MIAMPFFSPVVASGLTTLSLQDNATSTSTTITGPSSIQTGDLILLLDRSYGAAAPSTVVPSGFTSIVNTAGSNLRQIVSRKIADGSEASATITGMAAGFFGDVAKELYVFRGDAAISSVTASTPNNQATTGNPSSQSVTASGGTPPLIVFGAYGVGTGTVDPRTFSPAKDGEINGAATSYLAYKIYNSSPADVSIDMDDEGDENCLQSFYLECS